MRDTRNIREDISCFFLIGDQVGLSILLEERTPNWLMGTILTIVTREGGNITAAGPSMRSNRGRVGLIWNTSSKN